MHSLCMLKLTTTYPNGLTSEWTMPGHSVTGLTYTMDPFVRESRIRLSQIQIFIRRSNVGTIVATNEVA